MKRILSVLLISLFLICAVPRPPFFAAESRVPGADGELYQTVCAAIRHCADSIDVSSYGLKRVDFDRFVEHVKYENPEFFYLEDCLCSYSGETVQTIRPRYSMTGQTLVRAKERFAELAEELYAEADEGLSPIQIILFYHDLLAVRFRYDSELEIYDAYRFLSRERGVCQAYALTYLMVMRHFGIPCTYAASDRMGHMWNVVFADGAWYHVDVTYDDPVADRPGQARHDAFLIGSVTNSLLKEEADDTVYGAQIALSLTDHPLGALLSHTLAPAVEIGGEFYAILKPADSETALCQIDPVGASYTPLCVFPFDLSDGGFREWPAEDGHSYYLSNFSGLCTDGRYLYFHDSARVFTYDPQTGRAPRVLTSCEEGNAVCGLTFEGGTLTMHLAAFPDAESYTAVTVQNDMPLYYTLTWVVGADSFVTFAEEGSDPTDSFFGSTYMEDDRGIRYTFAGWSPAPSPVTKDAVYTAMYYSELLYLPGDADGNGAASIDDVSLLLNCLSGGAEPASFWAADMDGSDRLDVNDVTLLLDLLTHIGEET